MIAAARSLFEKVGADDMVRRAEKSLSEIGQG